MSNEVEEIKNRLNIVDIVSEYIKLTQAGGNFKAPCPFHQEKTPSFMVSSEKQIFHCFGCNKGGDMFTFVQEIEGCEFPEALKILAKKANVELRPTNPKLYSEKTKVLDVLKSAADFYVQNYQTAPEAQLARDYIATRNLNQDTLEEFKIGYAPDDWQQLYDYLKTQGFVDDEIYKSGMVVENATGAKRYYDRFRRRLMFPLRDVHGQVVGFTGRLLPGADEAKSGGKYVNTPQTIVYNKSYILFNLDLAKQAIKKAGFVILVEGQMDAISLYQNGIQNVVCVSGTALTEQQVNLLKRYTQNIILAFDMDEAGAAAMLRGVEQALRAEMNIKVLTLPTGKDPDECVQKDKPGLLQALKSAKLIIDHLFAITFEKLDMTLVQDKKKAVALLLPWLAKIGSPIEKSHYLQILGEKVGVSEDILNNELSRQRSQQPTNTQAKKNTPQTESTEPRTLTRAEKMSQRVLGFLLAYQTADLLAQIQDNLEPSYLAGADLQELYKKMLFYYTEKQRFETEEFIHNYLEKNSNLVSQIQILALLGNKEGENLEPAQIGKELMATIYQLKKDYLLVKLREVESKLKAAEKDNNQSVADELTAEFIKLSQKLRQL